jgi:arginine N-succinyltransferase
MLSAVGFRYARRVDPFDGGPHFVAPTEEVSLIRESRKVKLKGALAPSADRGSADRGVGEVARRGVILQYLAVPPYARSVQSNFAWAEGDGVHLPEAVRGHLGLDIGAEVVVTPLPSPEAPQPARSRAEPALTEA